MDERRNSGRFEGAVGSMVMFVQGPAGCLKTGEPGFPDNRGRNSLELNQIRFQAGSKAMRNNVE